MLFYARFLTKLLLLVQLKIVVETLLQVALPLRLFLAFSYIIYISLLSHPHKVG